ncbi:hypothetical protein JZ751_008835 [Albula glossodonta]|uniref:Uncharacterized protein n=1 Tax=Albula glossodonta TaxID=121402 RepID=A0A8T2P2Y5_9TELE|nr:hypothetical protein JZ751_008835 [Albula glossodonta]
MHFFLMGTLASFIFCLREFTVVPAHMTIHKNCSDLREGDSYVLQTERELGRSLDSCEQELEQQDPGNSSIMIGYFYNQRAEFTSPVLAMTEQSIRLDSCVNLSVTVICNQITLLELHAVPNEIEGAYQNTSHEFLVAITVVLVMVLVVALTVSWCKRRYRMRDRQGHPDHC